MRIKKDIRDSNGTRAITIISFIELFKFRMIRRTGITSYACAVRRPLSLSPETATQQSVQNAGEPTVCKGMLGVFEVLERI